MTEHRTDETEPAPAPKDRSGWAAFHEQVVLLQFKEGEAYIAPTYSHRPTMVDGGVRASPVMSGLLLVEDGAGPGEVMLILRTPIPDSEDYVLIAVDPRIVAFCSHVVARRIVTPG